mgnify:CR=1 FL=1
MSEEMIVRHCSPTLAGLKTGSLFGCFFTDANEMRESIRAWNKILVNKGEGLEGRRYWMCDFAAGWTNENPYYEKRLMTMIQPNVKEIYYNILPYNNETKAAPFPKAKTGYFPFSDFTNVNTSSKSFGFQQYPFQLRDAYCPCTLINQHSAGTIIFSEYTGALPSLPVQET